MFSFVTSLKLIVFVLFYHIVTFNFFFFTCQIFLLVSYAYVSIKSIDCIILSSFKLKAILLLYCQKIQREENFANFARLSFIREIKLPRKMFFPFIREIKFPRKKTFSSFAKLNPSIFFSILPITFNYFLYDH